MDNPACFYECAEAVLAGKDCPWPQENIEFGFAIDHNGVDEGLAAYAVWADIGKQLSFEQFRTASPAKQRCRYEGLRGLSVLGRELLLILVSQRDESIRDAQEKDRHIRVLNDELEQTRERQRELESQLSQVRDIVLVGTAV